MTDPNSSGERPTIRVRDEFAPVVDEALAALAAAPAAGLYVRGRILVRVVNAEPDGRTWLCRAPGAPVIAPVGAANLRERLDRAARWVRWDARSKSDVPALPPEWVAPAILDRGEWPFPRLVGVVEMPTVRPDGSILDRPGHDEATGLLYVPTVEVPPVPAQPTRDDAVHAAGVILDPFRDFPFRSPASRSAVLAACLTVVGRAAIDGPCPMFAVGAPSPGSGKDLLVNALTLGFAGRQAAAMTYTASDEEQRKRILAVALEGDPTVCLGNVEMALGSDALAHALTAVEWKDRHLGLSKMAQAPLRSIWFATGNNLRYSRTIGRRVVPIDLDAGVEHPEDRCGFAYPELLRHVQRERGALVCAALTIWRAFVAAGSPRHPAPAMGSYESWDANVRSCCVWLGFADPANVADPVSGRGRLRAESDDDLDGIADLLSALRAQFGDGAFTARTVADDEHLRTLADAACPREHGKKPRTLDARLVGGAFKAIRDRIVRGHKLVRDGDVRGGAAAWRVMVSLRPAGPAKTHNDAGVTLTPERPPGDSPVSIPERCGACDDPAIDGAPWCDYHATAERR